MKTTEAGYEGKATEAVMQRKEDIPGEKNGVIARNCA